MVATYSPLTCPTCGTPLKHLSRQPGHALGAWRCPCGHGQPVDAASRIPRLLSERRTHRAPTPSSAPSLSWLAARLAALPDPTPAECTAAVLLAAIGR